MNAKCGTHQAPLSGDFRQQRPQQSVNAKCGTHQKRQANYLRRGVDERFHPNLVAQVHELADQTEEMAPQLYVESVMLTQLIVSVIQTGTLLYSQLLPESLGRFAWAIDAKDREPTNYERQSAIARLAARVT